MPVKRRGGYLSRVRHRCRPSFVTTAAEAQVETLPVAAESAPDRLAVAAFAGAVAIGGTNFVAIRFSNRELDPLWGAGLRFALAAAVFGLLFAGLRLSLPRGRDLALVSVYGLLSVGAAYGCLYWALRDVPAGVGAVVLAVGPLLTLLLAVVHRMERATTRALLGAVVALRRLGRDLRPARHGRRSGGARSRCSCSRRCARPSRSSSRSSPAPSTPWR